MIMVKDIPKTLVSFINSPNSKKYGEYERFFSFAFTGIFFSLPMTAYHFTKTLEFLACSWVKDEHQEICHKNFQDISFYTNIISTGIALSGEIYLMHVLLD